MARQRQAKAEPEMNIRLTANGVQNIKVLADTPAARDAGLQTLLKVSAQINELERALQRRLYSIELEGGMYFRNMLEGRPMYSPSLAFAFRACAPIVNAVAEDLTRMGHHAEAFASPFNDENALYVGQGEDPRDNLVYRTAMGLPEPEEVRQ
jgi:hypothetical protein